MSAHMAHMQHSWNSRQQPPTTTTMPAPKDPPLPTPLTTTQNHHATTHTPHPPAATTADGGESSANPQVQPHPHCQHENGAAPSKTARYTTCRRVGDQHTSCPAQAATQTTLAMNNSVMCILPIDMQGNRLCMHQAASSTQAQPNG